MMIVLDAHQRRHEFQGEDGERLVVGYDNRGEPYREGASFEFHGGEAYVAVFLDGTELGELHRLLGRLLGKGD